MPYSRKKQTPEEAAKDAENFHYHVDVKYPSFPITSTITTDRAFAEKEVERMVSMIKTRMLASVRTYVSGAVLMTSGDIVILYRCRKNCLSK